jgi:hypothetical protein
MTRLAHPASLHNLTHETYIDMPKRLQASQWCEEKFGRMWEPFTNPEGRWTMVWGGHDEDTQTLINEKLTKSKKRSFLDSVKSSCRHSLELLPLFRFLVLYPS